MHRVAVREVHTAAISPSTKKQTDFFVRHRRLFAVRRVQLKYSYTY